MVDFGKCLNLKLLEVFLLDFNHRQPKQKMYMSY